MILVDNAVWSFGVQLSNGIPIIPFKHDKTDEEFLYLKNFLLEYYSLDDLRDSVRAAFSLEEMSDNNKFNDFIDYYDQDDIEDEQAKDDEFEDHMEQEHQME